MVLDRNVNTNEQRKFRDAPDDIDGNPQVKVGVAVEQDPSSPIPVAFSGATTPSIQNVSTPVIAGTEFTVVIPQSTKMFLLRSRDRATMQVGFNLGDSSTNYFTVNSGSILSQDSLALTSNLTIYLQCSKGSGVVEVFQWT